MGGDCYENTLLAAQTCAIDAKKALESVGEYNAPSVEEIKAFKDEVRKARRAKKIGTDGIRCAATIVVAMVATVVTIVVVTMAAVTTGTETWITGVTTATAGTTTGITTATVRPGIMTGETKTTSLETIELFSAK